MHAEIVEGAADAGLSYFVCLGEQAGDNGAVEDVVGVEEEDVGEGRLRKYMLEIWWLLVKARPMVKCGGGGKISCAIPYDTTNVEI